MNVYSCLLPVLALLTGCAGMSVNQTNAINWSSSAIRMEVSVEPKLLERGDKMEIRLVVTNTSDEVQTRSFSNGCIYGFSLRNNDDEIVAPPPPICTQNAPHINYQPGQVETRTFHWVWDSRELEPGVYQLVAGFGPRGELESAPPVEVQLR